MATANKKITGYTLRDPGILIETQELGDFTENALKIYGEEVNLNRAVPDYRDGLKPVTRRIMWALQNLPKAQLLKTAKLVGDCLGNYHPHSDISIKGAIATLVTGNVNPITGIGNWGSLIDPVGADRYTNVQMSAYGATFFGRNYFPLTTMMPTYDDKSKEPLYLPALLPNLLLNGTDGIGLGLTTHIPAFTPKSLLPILADMAEGVELTVKSVASRLEFSDQYGGVVVKNKESLAKVAFLLENTSGSVPWTSPFTVDRDAKSITISSFCPNVNPIKLVEDKLKPMQEVSRVDTGKGVSYIIQLRKDLNYNEFDAFLIKFKKMVSSSVSYHLYVTQRKEVDGKKVVAFANVPLLKLMRMWISYRIKLEVSSLNYRLAEVAKRDHYLGLLIRACDSLDIIFKALRAPDPKAHLIKGMKITDEEAEMILNLKVRQLTKLDQDKLTEEREQLANLKVTLNRMLKKPNLVVASFLRSHAERFTLDAHDCALQYTLGAKAS